MKRKVLGIVVALSFAFIILATDVAPAWAQTIVWTKQFGTWNHDYVWGIDVYGSAFYITGYTYVALPGQISKGGADAYVRKYDLNGKEIWTRQFGTPSDDYGLAISVDSSGVYVSGETKGAVPGQTNNGGSDAFVCKYDTSGNLKWTRQFGSSVRDNALGVAVYGGGVYVVGQGILPPYPFSGGYYIMAPFYVRKYDVYGNHKWTSIFGGIFALTQGSATGVAVYGSSVYIVGYSTTTLPGQTPGPSDGFVYKYDTSGKYKWAKYIVTSSEDVACGVAVSSSGYAYVAGFTYGALPGQTKKGGEDAFVRKYDAYGNVKWTRQFGSSSDDSAYAVAIYGSGIYVAGETWGTLPGQTKKGQVDPYVRKYDAYGNVKWTKQYGTYYRDGAKTISAASSGVFAAGITEGAFSGYTNKGGRDVFISKFLL